MDKTGTDLAYHSLGYSNRRRPNWNQTLSCYGKAIMENGNDDNSPISPEQLVNSLQLSMVNQGGLRMVDQNMAAQVFVTSSQYLTTTNNGGMVRTTSQQFSAKRVQSVNVTTSAHSFGDMKLLGCSTSDARLGGTNIEADGNKGKELALFASPVNGQELALFSPGTVKTSSSTALVPCGAVSDTERAIEATLTQTMETFQNLFQKQRQQFVNMFPQFQNVRAEPEITTETIVQPDGSVLIIEKQQSRRVMQFSQKTTIVNGVVQSTTTRAVMVYGGPEKGYEIKMEEVESSPVDSETEDDDDRVSLAPSEFLDDESTLIRLDNDSVQEVNTSTKKKLEKAWCAAEELVETERRYVAKLQLLDRTFRARVQQLQDKSISADKSSKLFSNVSTLLLFHSEHLLPSLEDRLREWRDTQKICDVMCRLAPYLKMYSEYTNNYKKATKVYEELKRKNKRFAAIVTEIEALPECDNLPLNSHLICPVQRVARYHLLMQEYLKNLPEKHIDRFDAESALEKVKVAANHANDMMRKLDKYKDVIEVQESLGGQIQGLVTPTRELIKKGQLTKISGRTADRQDRVLFLFDDLFLLCSDRRVSLTKYKLRAAFPMSEVQVLEGDNLELEHTFYIRSGNKTVELQAKTNQEKSEWMETLWNVMQNHKAKQESFGKVSSPVSSPDSVDSKETAFSPNGSGQKCCSKCQAAFKFLTKEYACNTCEMAVCKKCSKKITSVDGKEKRHVCNDCYSLSKQKLTNGTIESIADPNARKSLLDVKPIDDCVWKGTMEIRSAKSSWTKRYFALHSDYVLYCFNSEQDITARTSLLIPGCKLSLVDPKQDSFVSAKDVRIMFRLTHQNRTYYFKTIDENEMVKWMAALDLASQAELPTASNVS